MIGTVERRRAENEKLAAVRLGIQQVKGRDPASEGLAAAAADGAVGHGDRDLFNRTDHPARPSARVRDFSGYEKSA